MTGEPTVPTDVTPLWKRVLAWSGGTLAVALLVLVAVHVMIPPVSPAQQTPAGHYGSPCALCHIVSEATDVIDVGN